MATATATDNTLIEVSPQEAINNALVSTNQDAMVIAALLMTVIYTVEDIINEAPDAETALEQIQGMTRDIEPQQQSRTIN